MSKFFAKAVIKAFITLIFLIAVLYGALPHVAYFILSSQINDDTVQLRSLELGYPTWARIAIKNIVVDIADVGEFSLEDGIIEYSSANPYKVQFKSLRYNETQFNALNSAEPEVAAGAIALSDFFPKSLMQAAPNFELLLQKVSITLSSVEVANVRVTKQYQSLTFDADLVEGRGTNALTAKDKKNSQKNILKHVALKVSSNNTFRFTINHNGRGESGSVTGNLSLLSDALDGNVVISLVVDMGLHADDSLLSQFVDLTAFGVESAHIDTHLQITLPNQFVTLEQLTPLSINSFTHFTLQQADGTKLSANFPAHLNLAQGEKKVGTEGEGMESKNEVELTLSLFEKQSVPVSQASLASKQKASNKKDTVGKDSVVNIQIDQDDYQLTVNSPFSIQSTISASQVLSTHFAKPFDASFRVNDLTLASVVINNVRLNNEFSQLGLDLQSTVEGQALNTWQGSAILANKPIDFKLNLNTNFETSTLSMTQPTGIHIADAELQDTGLSNLVFRVPEQKLAIHHKEAAFEGVRVDFKAMYSDKGSNTLSDQAPNGTSSLVSGQMGISLNGETATVDIETYPIRLFDLALPTYKLSSEVSVSDEINAQFSMYNACDQLLLSGKWNAEQELVTVALKQTFSEGHSLTQWLNISDLPVNLIAGELTANMQLSLKEEGQPELQLKLKNSQAVGSFGVFEGMDFSFASNQKAPQQQSPQASYTFTADIAQGNVGVDVTDIVLRGHLSESVGRESWELHLDRGQAQLFGGEVSLAKFKANIDEDMAMLINVSQIDLSEVIASQSIEGLQTTGKLSGELPVVLMANGTVLLTAGKIYNRNGGKINYVSPLVKSTGINESLLYTLSILENLNYELLDTSVTLEEDNLVFKSKILGQNPDIENGRSVELNLNTDLPWRSALQAMQLKSGLDAMVEKFVASEVDSGLPANICK